MVLARCPNIKVVFVSDSLKDAGEQQMMIVVLALPPIVGERGMEGNWEEVERGREGGGEA